MMKSVELIIKGEKVNNVGYRPFLLLNALTHEIEKLYAFNAVAGGQEAVILRAEGEDEHIASYIEFVKSSYPPHAKVGSIEVKDFKGHVGDAYKYAQILQLEQMYKAIPAIISIDKKQDAMLEKQDATISILEEVREDTSAIKADISGLRKDASESLYEKYEQLCQEIAEIKATLSEIKARAA